MQSIIKQELNEHLITLDATMKSIGSALEVAANICIDSLKQGGKILIFGNGGSAADAQHIAAELVGRYKLERKGLSAIALSTDTSSLTAIANDYGYEHVFDRQIEALANPEDVAVVKDLDSQSFNKGEILDIEWGIHEIVIDIEASNKSFLVVSEVHYPKRWKLTIDNEPSETFQVNGVLRGVMVDAGKHLSLIHI
mgnify:CR=1 FL=1